jgi:hypothetical protein
MDYYLSYLSSGLLLAASERSILDSRRIARSVTVILSEPLPAFRSVNFFSPPCADSSLSIGQSAFCRLLYKLIRQLLYGQRE